MLFLTALAVILRILSNPVANVFQKTLTARGFHPLAVNFLSYAGLSLACLGFMMGVAWQQLPPPFWWYAVLSGMAGAVGNGFLVKALQNGDLSVLGPINAYKSVVGMLTGILLLGEFPNAWGVLGTILIIGGSYFVLDTTAERFSPALFRRKEIRYRLWALLLTAIEAVLLKSVILASSVTLAFFAWCVLGAIFSAALLPLYRVRLAAEVRRFSRRDLTHFVFLVFCLGVMQFTTNYVFDHLQVGYALALFQLSTIASVLLGYRIFRETGIAKKLLGAVIMLLGSVMIILLR